MTQKLYKITLRGFPTSVIYGTSYVIATDINQAYQIVRNDLEKRDIGFRYQRELKEIELIAEDCEYPDCHTRLYIS